MSKKYLETIEIIDLHICDPYLIVKIVNLWHLDVKFVYI